MAELKLSSILAIVFWAGIFILTWLLILERVQVSWLTGTSWLFFLLIALGASAIASGKK